MIDEGLATDTTTLQKRKAVAKWIEAVIAEMKNEATIVKNAWLKTGYEWFQDWGI